MGVIDRIQGQIEKLTSDETRLNAAEIATIQQAYNAMQLGLVKTEVYLRSARDATLKGALGELRDEFIKPHLDKPRRILEKAGIPMLEMNAQERLNHLPQSVDGFLRDEEIILDTLLSMEATIVGLQTGALSAVRGDVRDWFLHARDAAFDQWRKVGTTAYRLMPQVVPPTMSGVAPR